MTFSPIIPLPGLGGFSFLERTRDTQQATFDAQPRISRNTDAFAERIANVTSAADLVADRQLLEVALGAFGLDEDINAKYLIEKVLASDTADPRSLTSRFADKRYSALSEAFGFGSVLGPRTGDAGFADRIIGLYQERQFEIAVGETNADMRLALGFARDLGQIAAREGLSENGKWFTLMATPPLRTVMETALGLPKSFGRIDLDQQLGEFQSRARRVFGTADLAQLADSDKAGQIVERFLVRAQIADLSSASLSGANVALALLQR